MGAFGGNSMGPYEIVSPLGAGGMGEVYRARELFNFALPVMQAVAKDASAAEFLTERGHL